MGADLSPVTPLRDAEPPSPPPSAGETLPFPPLTRHARREGEPRPSPPPRSGRGTSLAPAARQGAGPKRGDARPPVHSGRIVVAFCCIVAAFWLHFGRILLHRGRNPGCCSGLAPSPRRRGECVPLSPFKGPGGRPVPFSPFRGPGGHPVWAPNPRVPHARHPPRPSRASDPPPPPSPPPTPLRHRPPCSIMYLTNTNPPPTNPRAHEQMQPNATKYSQCSQFR